MIEARIDLLFTMSENTCCKPDGSQTRIGQLPDEHLLKRAASMPSIVAMATSPSPTGGARRDRTDDLLLAKQALSQLSYGPSPGSVISNGLGGPGKI